MDTTPQQPPDSVFEHLQGNVLSLGVLKTSRDWINSFLVIGVTAIGMGAFLGMSSLTRTRAASKRSSAARDLGFSE